MIKGLFVIVIAAILVLGYVKYIEIKGIYFPCCKVELTPDILHIPFEDVYVETQDKAKINGWFIPGENAQRTILFCHGNAGNIGHRLEKIVLLRQANVNIFIIDYRGYGNSQGRLSERGLYLDARAAYKYLKEVKKIEPRDIILYGESLGGAVVVDLASKEKIGGLILEGTFSSGRDIAGEIYPFLPSFLFFNSFDSLAKIKNIAAPKLFIHSKDDEIVLLVLAKKLHDAAQGPKKFIEISGGHNTGVLENQEIFIVGIREFLEQV